MQMLQQATAIFCVACIGTELVALLVGPIRTVQCIKMAAGLYILTVFLSLLSGTPKALRSLTLEISAPAAAASWGTAEAQILTRAEQQLETHCTEQCRQQFGVEIQLAIRLEETNRQTVVTQASVAFPTECGTAEKQAALKFLQQELGTQPTVVEGAMP